MAITFACGSFTWPASSTDTISISPGFTPSAIMVVCSGATGVTGTGTGGLRHSIGFAIGTGSGNRGCSAAHELNGSAAMTCVNQSRDDCVAAILYNDALDGKLDITTWGSSPVFTPTDAISTDVVVTWYAWGGLDNVQLGWTLEPATVPLTVDISIAWEPSIVLFAGSQATAVNTNLLNDATVTFGYGKRTDTPSLVQSYHALMANQDDGSSSGDTDRVLINSSGVAFCTLGGGTSAITKFTFNQWANDILGLAWTVRGVTGRRHLYLAMKGGSWATARFDSMSGSSPTTISTPDLGFAPVGGLIFGMGGAASSTTTITQAISSIGGFDSSGNRYVVAYRSDDGTADSSNYVGYTNAAVYRILASPTSITPPSAFDIDYDSIDGNVVTFIIDAGTAEGALAYIIFGNLASGSPQSIDAGANTVTITAPTASLSLGNIDIQAGANTVTITAPTATLDVESGTTVVNGTEQAAGDDWQTYPGGWTTSSGVLWSGQWGGAESAGTRFTLDGAIPSGATIESAIWEVNTSTDTGPLDIFFYVTESADAPQITTEAGRPDVIGGSTDVYPTTADNTLVYVASGNWPNSSVLQVDVTSLIQHLVDTYSGLSSGAHIVVHAIGHTGTGQIEVGFLSWENNQDYPTLTIEYSEGAGESIDAGGNTVTASNPDASLSLGNVDIQASVNTITFTIGAALSSVSDLSAGQNVVTTTAPDVTIAQGQNLAAGNQVVTFTAPTASVSTGPISVNAGANTITITAPNVSVTRETNVNANGNTVTVTNPIVSLGLVASLAAGQNLVTVTNPVVSLNLGGASITAGQNLITFTSPDATLDVGGNNVNLNAGANTVTTTCPTVSVATGGVNIVANGNTVTVTSPVASVSIGGININAGAVTVTVTCPVATIELLSPGINLNAGDQIVVFSNPLASLGLGNANIAGGQNVVNITNPLASISSVVQIAALANTVTITAPATSYSMGDSQIAAGQNVINITAGYAYVDIPGTGDEGQSPRPTRNRYGKRVDWKEKI